MKEARTSETKHNLSALIDGPRGGSPVLIVDRARSVVGLERAIVPLVVEQATTLEQTPVLS